MSYTSDLTTSSVISEINQGSAPTINSDNTQGYKVGSRWWTSDTVYICEDTTTVLAVLKKL